MGFSSTSNTQSQVNALSGASGDSQTVSDGYTAYVAGVYEIASGQTLEIGSGSTYEVG